MYLDTRVDRTYSNAGPLRKRRHLDFSSVNDEKSLVSAAFRTERERAQMEYYVLALLGKVYPESSINCMQKGKNTWKVDYRYIFRRF